MFLASPRGKSSVYKKSIKRFPSLSTSKQKQNHKQNQNRNQPLSRALTTRSLVRPWLPSPTSLPSSSTHSSSTSTQSSRTLLRFQSPRVFHTASINRALMNSSCSMEQPLVREAISRPKVDRALGLAWTASMGTEVREDAPPIFAVPRLLKMEETAGSWETGIG